MCVFLFWQISLSVTEELHIIYFDTVFQHKGLSVELQVVFLLQLFLLYGWHINVFCIKKCLLFLWLKYDLNKKKFFFPGTQPRPPPSQWLSSPTPASSRVPGHLSSGSTWSVRTPRWEIPVTDTQHRAFCSLVVEINFVYMCVCFFRTSCSLPTVLQPLGRSLERCWAGSFSLPLNVVWMTLSWRWLLTDSLVNPASMFCFSCLSLWV